MVYITNVHMSGGTSHEHIAEVKWRNPTDGKTGSSTTATMIDWIDNKSGSAKVSDGYSTVDVLTVNGAYGKYLRTHANGKWTDNLLSLPRY